MAEHWTKKFVNALRGIRLGCVGQSSFLVHLPVGGLVLLVAWLCHCSAWQWCVLSLCIALVLSAELINSSIEHLAKGLCNSHNEDVGRALDIASGAVLVASIAAAAIGTAIFASQAATLWSAN